MSVLPVGFGSAVAGGYQIQRSLRFNSADSAYLNRTLTTPTNNKIWTWSGWVKRSAFGTAQALIGTTDDNTVAANVGAIRFTTSNTLEYFEYSSAYSLQLVTTQVFRDPSAWYHTVFAIDTTQATSSNRVKLYVNGVQVTVFGTATYPALNLSLYINSARATYQGSYWNSSSGITAPFNGYLTEINFIDGLTPNTTTRTVNGVTQTILTELGQFNTNTGVWEPAAWTRAFGTNGFYVNFSDNSVSPPTATTLGKDYSGNGNNWTPNGLVTAAGAGNDSLVDSPTAYGTDTGVGGEVRGNYCTLNPLDKGTNATLANGNLFGSTSTTAWAMIRSTFAISSGKWYWEFTVATTQIIIGLAKSNAALANYVGADANGWGWYGATGNKVNGGTQVTYVGVWAANDVIGVSFDADVGTLVFYKNGTSQGTAYTGLTSGPYFPAISFSSASDNANANFGQRAFAYTAPSGFKALCTTNLPTPTIGATSTTQANDYFNSVLYTGTGSSLSVTGVGFQPDFTWIKGRSGATDHGLYDAVRGVQKQLESNTNVTAETTETTGLTAFGSDGFTVGALAQLNTSSATYVAWNWNAGGSNQTISVGQYATSPTNVPSIASTVRANTTSGFSIVTYTGNGSSGATIGHGCQVGGVATAPSFIIVKNRGSANKDWECYHISLGNTNRIRLNVTAAADTGGTMWANTSPTSTVFSVGSDADVNASTNTYVAYCFAPVAGYSAFGSYTGNGSTDGPFVYTGFRPRWLLRKRYDTGTTSDWQLIDTAREEYNPDDSPLWPNLPNAQSPDPAFYVDMLSNGFKLRGTTASTNLNANGGTYIYAAFAEHPFKYSLAR